MPQDRPFRVAVIGDTHYVNPACYRRLLNGTDASPEEVEKAQFYAWATAHVLPRLIEEVRAAAPDLVVHLGDVVHGHRDEGADRAVLLEALEALRAIGRPLLFVRGTHEGAPGGEADAIYRRAYLAEVARTLGRPPGTVGTTYSLATDGCRLIVLDYTTFQPNGEADHLLTRELAAAGRRREHIFVFGHAPLLPVDRPTSSSPGYAQTILRRLAEAPAPADAYFCGHTHQQIVTAHRIGQGDTPRWLAQLQGVPLGDPDQEPVPLGSLRALLPSPDRFRYGWGFVQRSAPGWFLIEVTDRGAVVEWRALGAGRAVGRVAWRTPGRPELTPPPGPAAAALPAFPLHPADQRVRSAVLHVAGAGSRAAHRVRLNGYDLGVLPPLSSFEARKGLAVPKDCWGRLGPENELCVEPVAAEERCLGHFVLELVLAKGSVVRTVPPPDLFTTSARWNLWPDVTPRLRRVDPMAPVRVTLRFPAPPAPRLAGDGVADVTREDVS